MRIEDLQLSDSTKGFLRAKKISVPTLMKHRDDLTEIDGIGPARAKEIETAFVNAERTAPASGAEKLPEVPEVDPEAPFDPTQWEDEEPEDEGEDEEEVEAQASDPFVGAPIGELVRYLDRSGNAMSARVAAHNEDGTVNLQAFTGVGGAHRIENVHRAGEWGELGRWAPMEEA